MDAAPLPTPTTSKAPAPEMCMIPSPGDTSAATPLDSVGRGKGCYDSCAPITLPRYFLEVGVRADTRAGAHGGYPSSGDGTVGGRQELAAYDNAAYDVEPPRNTRL